MPLYEYTCPTGHKLELVRPMGVETEQCPCGQISVRGHVHRIVAHSPEVDLRGMYRRFNEASSELAHGGIDLPLYQMAKAKAGAMAARGESPQIKS